MAEKMILSLLLILIPRWTTQNYDNLFIIWNVGQGSWSTLVKPNACFHFDMGGEFFPNRVYNYCLKKKNVLIVSHWDKDHYSFIQRFNKRANICLSDSPQINERKLKRKFSQLKSCPNVATKILQNQLYEVEFAKGIHYKDKNDTSLVFSLNNILIPGDITSKKERWVSSPESLSHLKKIILPHHGSNTSSSVGFLKMLKNTRLAIASCRKQKYGHPHYKVKKRLMDKSISLISTEHWGSIFIQY